MTEVIIVNGDESPAAPPEEHCPACEARFLQLETRLAAIEQHHPVIDAAIATAQEMAEEAAGQAQEAQETAEEAAEIAVVAAISTLVENPVENSLEEEKEDAGETIQSMDTGAEEGEGGEAESEGSGAETPVILQLAPEPEQQPRRGPTRFTRGR